MTVTAKDSIKIIDGDGWSNPLTHDAHLENSSHLEVWADDVQLTGGVDYSVSGVGNLSGYSVTITTPGSWTEVANWALVVKPPMNQPSDLSAGGTLGGFYEDALDYIGRRLQYLNSELSRAVKRRVDLLEDTPEFVSEIYDEGTVLKIDEDGNIIEGPSVATIEAAATYASNAAASASAAATSASAAAGSASAAAASVSSIGDAVTDAQGYASAASTSASNASTSAGSASTSASAASDSAAAAAAAATNAATAATAAIADALEDMENAAGLGYEFSTSTTASDPGAGTIRLNNATLASVTAIYIDNVDGNGNTVSGLIDAMGGPTATNKAILTIRQIDNPVKWASYAVTGVTDSTGYRTLAVSHLASGTRPDNTARVVIGISLSGDDGASAVNSVNGETGTVTLGAADIDIADSGGLYVATDIEAALAEVMSDVDDIEMDYLDSGDIGVTVQGYNALLAAIAGLTPTDSNFIVGNGSSWVAETGSTVRTSLGLGTLATLSSINNGNWSGTDLSVANGGTGRSSNTANALIAGGTTTTNAHQSISNGTSGHVLTSNGTGALPSFQAPASASPLTAYGTAEASDGSPSWVAQVGFNATIDDDGTGNYGVTFASALAGPNYVAVAVVSGTGGAPDGRHLIINNKTAAGFDIRVEDSGGSGYDRDFDVMVIDLN